jgi:mitochondrial import inner membrane translocase subunit TIM50
MQFITQPTSRKLLYDPVHPDLHPKTLVLNLTGTIIKSEYIFGKGVKTTVRPGLENLLRRLSQKYEIVIFAEEDEYTLMNKVMKIDPKQMHIRGVLGREAMVWKNGEFIKDLRYLNRDLRKVVVVDRKIENVKNHPENTIILSEFQGDESDNELTKLAVLLESISGLIRNGGRPRRQEVPHLPGREPGRDLLQPGQAGAGEDQQEG